MLHKHTCFFLHYYRHSIIDSFLSLYRKDPLHPAEMQIMICVPTLLFRRICSRISNLIKIVHANHAGIFKNIFLYVSKGNKSKRKTLDTLSLNSHRREGKISVLYFKPHAAEGLRSWKKISVCRGNKVKRKTYLIIELWLIWIFPIFIFRAHARSS